MNEIEGIREEAVLDFMRFLTTQRNWDGVRIGWSRETLDNISKYLAKDEKDPGLTGTWVDKESDEEA